MNAPRRRGRRSWLTLDKCSLCLTGLAPSWTNLDVLARLRYRFSGFDCLLIAHIPHPLVFSDRYTAHPDIRLHHSGSCIYIITSAATRIKKGIVIRDTGLYLSESKWHSDMNSSVPRARPGYPDVPEPSRLTRGGWKAQEEPVMVFFFQPVARPWTG